MWYDETGRRRGLSRDSKDDATEALNEELARVARVRAAAHEVPKGERLFSDLCDRWLSSRTDKRSLETDASFIRVHLRPAFGDLELREIGVELIEGFRAAREDMNPSTVNHHLTLLGSLLRHAVDLGWLEAVPKIQKHRLTQKSYDWLHTPEEIAAFLRAAAEEKDPTVAALYATAVYTGMRAGELAGLRRSDVAVERRVIEVSRSYDGPTKGGEIRHVPIVDRLQPVLRDWLQRAPLLHDQADRRQREREDQGAEPRPSRRRELVFTSQAGGQLRRDSRVFRSVLDRVLERAGEQQQAAGEPTTLRAGAISIHDLRHTFASHWMMNGGDLFRLQRVLGHKDIATTQRYAHLAPNAFEGDLGRFG